MMTKIDTLEDHTEERIEMAKKKIEPVEFDILGDINDAENEKTKISDTNQEGVNAEWGINSSNVLVGRLSNANINWVKIGNKNKFLRMAQEFDNNYDKYIDASPKMKAAYFSKATKASLEKSTPADWDRLLSMAIIAKYQEDRDLAQRRRDVIHAQRILRDKDSDSDDINRAKATISMNKDLINVEVQTNQNEGLIITHVSLSDIQNHINREKELSQ